MRRRSFGADPAGFFVLRTPLLPLDELFAFGRGLRAAHVHDEAEVDAALARDRALLTERVRSLAARPEIREAIFVASPSLAESLDEWAVKPDGKRGERVAPAFVRYFSRMCARSTPFGLFAGISVGRLGPESSSEGIPFELHLEPRERYARRTRLDMDYLSTLAEALAQDRALREELVHVPNSSLYECGGQLRFAEATVTGRERVYDLIGLEPTDYLRAVLSRARGGARLSELAEVLVGDDVTLDEALDFVHELIDGQILVSRLSPNVTGSEPIVGLVSELASTRAGASIAARLAGTRDALDALDARAVGATEASAYRAVAADLAALPAPVELQRLFQVDMSKPLARATLPRAVLDEAIRAVALLAQFADRADEPLKQFREAFVERYEPRRWVRLVDALDEAAGIGFGPPANRAAIVDGLGLGRAQDTGASTLTKSLLAKLQEAIATGARAVAFTEADLSAFARSSTPARVPDVFSVMITLVAASERAVDEGAFQLVIRAVSAAPGSRLLGRFCHGNEQLTHSVRAYHELEASFDDAIYAEVVHLPEGRIGNVLLRPLLREREIVYLGRSGAPSDDQISVDDLWIRVVGDRIELRSERLGRRVVPRLTTAHNFTRGLPIYRFLGHLQRQDAPFFGFSWGVDLPFEPRVVSGRLILSRARWNFDESAVAALKEAKDPTKRWLAIQDLRARLDLPRFVAAEDGDNELLVDLDNVLSVESFTSTLMSRRTLTLTEALVDGLCVRGPEGSFCHQIILPFVRTRGPDTRPGEDVARVRRPTVERTFPPGSEWLYAKLYTSHASADRILREVVAPWTGSAARSGAADRWFFLRYADPKFHIRVRLHGPPERLAAEVLPELHRAARAALAEGRLWKIELGTYEREIERYGGDDGILLAEELFHQDSKLVLRLLEALADEDMDDVGWQVALRGMMLLLEDFELDLRAKRRILAGARDALHHENGIRRPHPPLGERFRRERARVEQLMSTSLSPDDPLAAAAPLFAERSSAQRSTIARLWEAERSGRLTSSLEELVTSFLHMHANRVLRSSARAQELVLHDFLDRVFESEEARSKQGPRAVAPSDGRTPRSSRTARGSGRHSGGGTPEPGEG